ncbi:hypothetical protein [Andreesenia angusta]|nr:hypothetical protein [Andreesenia angusta]
MRLRGILNLWGARHSLFQAVAVLSEGKSAEKPCGATSNHYGSVN